MARVSRVSKLEEILQEELGTTKCKSLGFASGGCINEGQSFDTDQGKIFVKLNEKSEARKMFDGEFKSLEAICKTDTIRVPEPIKVLDHPSGRGAVFVQEYLDMNGLRKYQAQLGTQLGRLHLNNIKKLQNSESGKDKDPTSVDKFGFHIATCCGYLTQNNEWHDDWVAFYTKCRLQHQIDLIDNEYSDTEARLLWSRLKSKIPEFFKGVDVKPSLLHGDLWSGNVAETHEGPVAFDPASFYGHHEYDLAIAGMFGGFTKAFYDAYHKEIPKQKGFEKRHELYKLFHHLNHWNHFGTGYRSSSLSIMQGLIDM
ncbi:ketosamine-3-kinase-like isoform X1 [Acropora muricata]|uniref:ketosamine-3-kinase-like isoform X1 n=1 Tax=Acropora muricata TaxID=159855 RepID=UPI0034E3DAC4